MQEPVTISTFYSFTPVADPHGLRSPLLARMKALGIRGTITLASEGVNATISGTESSIQDLIAYLHELTGLTLTMRRESHFGMQPFRQGKVKVKGELISLGVPSAPAVCVGEYVAPGAWNALITAGDVVVIDTRNAYEFALGHFPGAINPATRNFKQMVAFTEKHLDRSAGRRIAMYCTGGIRCEKYSSYLVASGFDQVYHLRGGILAYLEQIPVSESLWTGDCFVFDERVGVGHGLIPSEVRVA